MQMRLMSNNNIMLHISSYINT